MEISATKVAQVIVLARELDRAEGEFRAFVERLGVDEQAELVALMWIGRGSFDSDEWHDARATAQAEPACHRL